jgi:acetyl esterase/lipase
MGYPADLDPELVTCVARLETAGLTARHLGELVAGRERSAALLREFRGDEEPDPRVLRQDVIVPGGAASPDVRARIYRPTSSMSVLPCLLWIHGGGMVVGSIEGDDWRCEGYVATLGCAVVSVEYRLAPEHSHPAAVEDCYSALRWVSENGPSIGIDTARIALAGASAGGGIAAGVALLARDRGGPKVNFQLLIGPMLDDRNVTPSSREFTTGHPAWTRELNIEAWTAYLGKPIGGDDVSPYAAPARARDLSNLPPTMIQIAEFDVFRDESIAYAHGLMKSGVSTALHFYAGAFHGFDTFAPDASISRRSIAERMAALDRALS